MKKFIETCLHKFALTRARSPLPPKIVNFSAGKNILQRSLNNTECSKVNYSSSGKCDVYSLGLVAYNLTDKYLGNYWTNEPRRILWQRGVSDQIASVGLRRASETIVKFFMAMACI